MTNTELEILEMGLEELWNVFKKRAPNTCKEYRVARFGKRIMFDINDHLNGRIPIKAKTGEAYLNSGRYRAVKLVDYETELEAREREMTDWLIENLGEEDIAHPRGMVEEEEKKGRRR